MNKYCIRCGKPIAGKRGSGHRESFCRKHAAEYQRHYQAGTVDEWRLGNEYTERKNRFYSDPAVQAALDAYCRIEYKNTTAKELAGRLGCGYSSIKLWIKKYSQENGIPVKKYAGTAVVSYRKTHREELKRKEKRAQFRGKAQEEVESVLERVVKGEILSAKAAEELGVSVRSISRWIKKLHIVNKVGYDMRKNKQRMGELVAARAEQKYLEKGTWK